MKKELKIIPKKQASSIEPIDMPEVQNAEAFAEKILTQMRSVEGKGNTKRVNFDMPIYLFDLMEDKVKRKGHTIKNYLTGLVRKDLGDE
jgi:hypothetical protein